MGKIIIGIIMVVVPSIFCVVSIVQCVDARIEWENEIGYAWDLADKSSTLEEKSRYIDEFIVNLNEMKHSEYGTIFFKTKENRFDLNLKALESLGKRLKEIQSIDIDSFAYQTAIQQITAQEQGEASSMIDVFYGAFTIENYLWAFEGMAILLWVVWTFLVCGGSIFVFCRNF